jgi:hypothetical protein
MGIGLLAGIEVFRTACICFGGSGFAFVNGVFRGENGSFGVSRGLLENVDGSVGFGDLISGGFGASIALLENVEGSVGFGDLISGFFAFVFSSRGWGDRGDGVPTSCFVGFTCSLLPFTTLGEGVLALSALLASTFRSAVPALLIPGLLLCLTAFCSNIPIKLPVGGILVVSKVCGSKLALELPLLTLL